MLSLCMIVKDESKLLDRCLSSVKDYIDEIVIIDTGSRDNTKEIAESFGAKVYDFEWCDDFSAARNFSLSKATKEWILVLDADEVIAEKDMKKMRELIGDDSVDGYQLIQRNYSDSLKGVSCGDDYEERRGYRSYFPSVLVRLFRNKGYRFENRVHELIDDSVKGKVINSKIPIHHLKDESKDRTEQYLRMWEKQIELTPGSPKPYYEVAKLYKSKEEYGKALEYFKKAIELLGDRKNLLISKLVYLEAGNVCFKLKNYNEALGYFDKAIENDDKNCWPYFYKALILHEEGKISEAKGMYHSSMANGIRDPAAYGNLGEIYLKEKDWGKAYLMLSKACKLRHPKKEQIEVILDKLRRFAEKK